MNDILVRQHFFLNLDVFEVETITFKQGKSWEFHCNFLSNLGAETDENERPSCCCPKRQGTVSIYHTAVFSLSPIKVPVALLCFSQWTSWLFFPHMLSSPSPLKAPAGRLSHPLTLLPLRGRSLRSVSFNRCLFAQCRRRFWNSKTLLVMEPHAVSLSLDVCCGRLSPIFYNSSRIT